MSRNELYKRFWKSFIELPESKIPIHSKIKPTDRGSIGLGFDDHLAFYYVLKGTQSHVALYINHANKNKNKQIFSSLLNHRIKIEDSFGTPFVWQKLEDKSPCRIRYEMEIGDLTVNEHKWNEIQVKMIDAMVRFQKELLPYIEKFS